MADTNLLYVDAGYVATDYTEELPAYLGASIQAGTFTATAEAFVDPGSGYVINDYVDNEYVGLIKFGLATLSSEFSQTAQPLKLIPATASLSAEFAVTDSGVRLRQSSLTATATTQISATPIKIRDGASLEVGEFTVSAESKVAYTASSSMSAFNATVYAGTRLRYADATMSASFSQTALGGRVSYASNGIVNWDEIPVTGIQLYDETDITLDVIGSDPAPEFIQDFVFSMWAKSDNTQGGTILSARGPASNLESVFRFNLSSGSMRVSWDYSAGSTGGFDTTLIMSSVNITDWHHYWIKCRRTISNDVEGKPLKYTIELYVDGSLQDTNIEYLSTTNGEIQDADDPITVGAYRYLNTYSELFRGVLAQAWLSQDSFAGFDTVSDFYDAGWVDLGTDGTKGSTLNMPPDWYEPWDYPYTSRTNNADSTNYPTRLLNPAPAIFTVSANGDNVIGGLINLSSEFAVTAQALKVQDSSADLTSAFTATPTALRIKPADATPNAEFTILPAPTSELFGEASLEAFANATLIGTSEIVGEITMAVESTMTATAYDFTKAQAAIDSEFTTNIVATALIPQKGNIVAEAFAQVVADPTVIRGDRVELTVVSTVTPTALRIFANTATLSALAFAISAGRLIEFRDENTLTVARETGQLLVDYEPRQFMVEEENRINTTIREQRIVVVEQEQGELLVDEEQ